MFRGPVCASLTSALLVFVLFFSYTSRIRTALVRDSLRFGIDVEVALRAVRAVEAFKNDAWLAAMSPRSSTPLRNGTSRSSPKVRDQMACVW